MINENQKDKINKLFGELSTISQVQEMMTRVVNSDKLKFYEKESLVKQLQIIAKTIEMREKEKERENKLKPIEAIKVVFISPNDYTNVSRIERLENEIERDIDNVRKN